MSTLDTNETITPYWVLIHCLCSPFHHYRPGAGSNNETFVCTRTGDYPGCGKTVTLADLPAPAAGDTMAIVDGVLQYGIDPAATFTYRHMNGEFGWPRTFPARELAEYLRHICVWQDFTITRALVEAARDGVHDHESGYGLKTRIVRNKAGRG